MSYADTVAGLSAFPGRGAGTNAERRAALWLAGELRGARREAILETFWCRPNWALAHAWHAALALAGSLVSVPSPKVGGALIIVAVVSVIVDALTGISPGRRLTREHASQNVVSPARNAGAPVRLILTANYDSGRMGLVHRPRLRRALGRLREATGPLSPGWLGWLLTASLWVLVVAILRDRGATGTSIGIAQLIPTVGLVLAVALLIELSVSDFGPGANDNASGAALALAVARALDAAPPGRLAVEVVLSGAGDGAMAGLSQHLRRRRRELQARNTIVLGFAASGAGRPRWWTSDGSLLPLRFLPRLAQLAQSAATDDAQAFAAAGGSPTPGGSSAAGDSPTARPHRGRGLGPAYPARLSGLPAITLGCLGPGEVAPRSHTPDDISAHLDRASGDRVLALALALIDAIDLDLSNAASGRSGASRAAA